MPNAFSPNADGLNDGFGIRGNLSLLTAYNLNIYNRWGELVYSTYKPIENWDGMYKGKRADMGTYFWYATFKYRGKEYIWKGDLTLIQ